MEKEKEEEEETPKVPTVTEMMESAKEADFVARAKASSTMGPAMQPEEEKRKEKEDFELSKPKDNKWASGAFKRGLALQVRYREMIYT